MIVGLYTVRDNVAGAFLQPFFSVNNGSALRSLKTVVNDKEHEFGKHTADYSVYHIGTFDDTTGTLAPLPEPERLLNLVDLVG